VSPVDGGRFLVTGATGFTGGHLCRRLARDGYAVRALVRDATRAAALAREGVELVTGDLRDRDALARATRDVAVVYHIAAIFRPENVSRRDMWAVNVEGTRNVLDAAVEAGVRRLVHCSTVGVHGDVKIPPANETAPYGPGDHYQESKTEGERVVLDYMTAGRLPIVVFRPGGIYGPRDLRFLKLFRGIKRRRFVMLGPGTVAYQMIYIDDLIDGILLCGTREQAIGNVYILTGEEPVTLNELVRLVAETVGVPPPRWRFPVAPVYLAGLLCELGCKPFGIDPPLHRRRVDFFRKTRSFDIGKARAQLGFKPRTDLREGLRLTAAWYRAQGYL
jgi:nucleoside-diphosphate-sugar epimerase